MMSYFVVHALHGQQAYDVANGKVQFVSDAPFELIQAVTTDIHGLFDLQKNTFEFTLPIRSFTGFNSALQQHHFNDKYLESDRYPNAKFSGVIIEQLSFSDGGMYVVRAKGELDVHGVKQTRIIKLALNMRGDRLLVTSHFIIPLADHDITIPTLIGQKVASDVLIDLSITMIRKL